MDIYPWMRMAATDAGLDPDRCALASLDPLGWRAEPAPDGPVRILRKHGVLLSDDERIFSLTVITGGSGRWDLRDDRITSLAPLAPGTATAREEELAEAGQLLRGEVFFPPALFQVSYPPRREDIPLGAIVSATVRDRPEQTAFRRDGTIETSPLPEMSVTERGLPRRIPEWIEDPYSFASEQASREKPLAQFRCPCCQCLTLMERGTFETCPVCCWEDDGQDDPHADEPSGPNHLTLTQARENFRTIGAMEARHASHGRPPTPDEI
jgi:Cysteine-rich CPCC